MQRSEVIRPGDPMPTGRLSARDGAYSRLSAGSELRGKGVGGEDPRTRATEEPWASSAARRPDVALGLVALGLTTGIPHPGASRPVRVVEE